MKMMRPMPHFSRPSPNQSTRGNLDDSNSKSDAAAAAKHRPRWLGLLTRMGPEGKIVSAVTALLIAAIGSTCWLWASRIDQRITAIMGEQARQTAYTLSMTARP